MATLETIVNSDTKVQIIRTLALNRRSYSAKDLEEATTKDITSIYKALEELRNENFLKIIKTDGKTKLYDIEATLYSTQTPDFKSMLISLIETEINQYNLDELPPHPINITFDFRKKLINKIEELENIILFGSAANGKYALGSDIDLYIVCQKKNKDIEDKIHDLAENYNHEFSLIIKSKAQYKNDFSKPLSKLADSIIKDGFTTLYGEIEEINQYIENRGE